jgi:hypothetical protein
MATIELQQVGKVFWNPVVLPMDLTIKDGEFSSWDRRAAARPLPCA